MNGDTQDKINTTAIQAATEAARQMADEVRKENNNLFGKIFGLVMGLHYAEESGEGAKRETIKKETKQVSKKYGGGSGYTPE